MVGVVIVTHGGLAQALIDSAAMLVGEPQQMAAVGIHPGDAPDEFYKRVEQAISEVDTGQGVVALADLYGGTPNNNVARAGFGRNVRLVTGVNLPMVVYAAMERSEESTLQQLVDGLIATGNEGISEFMIPKK